MSTLAPDSQEQPATMPVAGILGVLVGLGLLLLYFKGHTPSSPTLRLLQFGFGSATLLFGIKETLFRDGPARESPLRRWIPYQWGLTREGIVFVVIMMTVLIGGLITSSNLLLLVFGLLAGPFVVNGYVTLTMLKGNTLERHAPPRVMAGEPCLIDIAFTNRRRWFSGWMMVVQDHLRHKSETLRPRILFARIPPRATQLGTYQVRLVRRGRYKFGALRMSTRFPLGLVDRALSREAPGEILVYPRLGLLTSQWRRSTADADELVQQNVTRAGAYDDDFHRLREYRAGDNPRAIHWRTSARRDQLMVREYQQNRDQDLLVILDLWLPTPETPDALARIELAVALAATLCVEHCRQNRESHLALAIAGRESGAWRGTPSPAAMNSLLDLLATAEGAAKPGLAAIAREAFAFRQAHVRRVLVSTRPAAMATESSLAEVQQEARQQGLSMRLLEASPTTLAPYFEWEPIA